MLPGYDLFLLYMMPRFDEERANASVPCTIRTTIITSKKKKCIVCVFILGRV